MERRMIETTFTEEDKGIEGSLRPQLLDRFGLVVEIRGEQDVGLRAELIRRRLDYESDPTDFCRRWEPEQAALIS